MPNTDKGDYVVVPRRWVQEIALALDAASVIGMRSCRDGDHLLYSNHDRLLREADEAGWTGIPGVPWFVPRRRSQEHLIETTNNTSCPPSPDPEVA